MRLARTESRVADSTLRRGRPAKDYQLLHAALVMQGSTYKAMDKANPQRRDIRTLSKETKRDQRISCQLRFAEDEEAQHQNAKND